MENQQESKLKKITVSTAHHVIEFDQAEVFVRTEELLKGCLEIKDVSQNTTAIFKTWDYFTIEDANQKPSEM